MKNTFSQKPNCSNVLFSLPNSPKPKYSFIYLFITIADKKNQQIFKFLKNQWFFCLRNDNSKSITTIATDSFSTYQLIVSALKKKKAFKIPNVCYFDLQRPLMSLQYQRYLKKLSLGVLSGSYGPVSQNESGCQLDCFCNVELHSFKLP